MRRWRRMGAAALAALLAGQMLFAVPSSAQAPAEPLAPSSNPAPSSPPRVPATPPVADPDEGETIDATKPRRRSRIIRGEAAPSSAEDAIVAIRFTNPANGRRSICTGTAVSGNAIVTAGHCTCGDRRSYDVVIGASTQVGRAYPVGEVLTFPGFDCRQPEADQPGLDVGLILLRDDVDALQKRAVAISLLGDVLKSRPASLQVYGYGLTEFGGLGERRTADIKVRTLSCTDPASRRAGCQSFYEFVLSSYDTSSGGLAKDSCGGDSGGPVFWHPGDGQRYLVGVVSRGLRSGPVVSGQPCGGGGIYSTIGRHTVVGWIRRASVALCLRGESCEPPHAAAEIDAEPGSEPVVAPARQPVILNRIAPPDPAAEPLPKQ